MCLLFHGRCPRAFSSTWTYPRWSSAQPGCGYWPGGRCVPCSPSLRPPRCVCGWSTCSSGRGTSSTCGRSPLCLQVRRENGKRKRAEKKKKCGLFNHLTPTARRRNRTLAPHRKRVGGFRGLKRDVAIFCRYFFLFPHCKFLLTCSTLVLHNALPLLFLSFFLTIPSLPSVILLPASIYPSISASLSDF